MSAVEYERGLDRFPASSAHDQPFYRDVVPRFVPVTTPAAGAEWSVPVPGGFEWHVQAIAATLVTSAAVANRFAALTVTDGTSTPIRVGGTAAIVASTTARLSWLLNFATAITASAPSGLSTPWPNVPLLGGWTISSASTALDAADQYSAIVLYVFQVEWREMTRKDAFPRYAQTWRRQYHAPLLEEVE